MITALILIILASFCGLYEKKVPAVVFSVIGIILVLFFIVYVSPPKGCEEKTVLTTVQVENDGVATKIVEETFLKDGEGNYYVTEKNDFRSLFAPFGKREYIRVDTPVLEVYRLAQCENETTNTEENDTGG